MCQHCKQIWHNGEYCLFLIGMHDEDEEGVFCPRSSKMDNRRENRYSLYRVYSLEEYGGACG